MSRVLIIICRKPNHPPFLLSSVLMKVEVDWGRRRLRTLFHMFVSSAELFENASTDRADPEAAPLVGGRLSCGLKGLKAWVVGPVGYLAGSKGGYTSR